MPIKRGFMGLRKFGRTNWLAALLLAFALAGCAGMFTKPGEIPVKESLSAPEKAAQTAINEANVLLAAAARIIGQNAADGIASKAEAQSQLNAVKKYAADIDKAKKLLDAGDILGAKTQAELVHKLVIQLHREVASRARKQ